MTGTIAILPGDGVGPEVTAAAVTVLRAVIAREGRSLDWRFYDFGGAAIDAQGDPFPDATRAACLEADAVLLGAIGGPQWDQAPKRPEAGLLALRSAMGVFANLRPVTLWPGGEAMSPLRDTIARGIDMLIVRELTGGLYFGEKVEGTSTASDLCTYTRDEVERVAHKAFQAARLRRGRVTSVDKANVIATSRLWRAVVSDIHARDYSDVVLEHVLVDAMAMKLIQQPSAFDVILTENLFGDILSDEASVLTGSIGLAPSASLGEGHRGLYEPIHGSAPDIAGTGKANPIGAILSAAMMLQFSFGAASAAAAIEQAVRDVLAAGRGTPDIGGSDTTDSLALAVADALK